jgi:hypothetical protein
MPITLKNQGTVSAADAIGASSAPSTPVTRQRHSGHSKALPVTLDLSQPGRLRLGHLMTLFSIGHTTVYVRLREGAIPQRDGTDGGRPYWKTKTIKTVLDR